MIGNFVTLTLFDPECDTIVTTDASGYGISGVMSQIHDGKECIVACASRTLTETERKYSVGEREALACVWACERWYRYLWGRHFILRTDHSALTTLLSAKGTGRQTMRIARWNSRLMNFNYTIVHHAGVSPEIKIADCLSRLPLPDVEVNDYEEEVILFLTAQISDSTVTLSEVQVATAEGPILVNISKFVQKGWPKKSKIDSNWLPYFNI